MKKILLIEDDKLFRLIICQVLLTKPDQVITVTALQAQLEAEEEELALMSQQEQLQHSILLQDRTAIAQLRKADQNGLPQTQQEEP